MNFNIVLRNKLNYFLKKFDIEVTNVTSRDIDNVCTAANELFYAYNSTPETSSLAQVEFYQAILNVLNKYHSVYKNQKSWAQTIFDSLTYYPYEEERILYTISNIESAYAAAIKKNDHVYDNFTLQLYRYCGVSLRTIFEHKNYDEYSREERLKYFSHHLMGNANLMRHKVLQGKPRPHGTRDFINDLTDFIKRKRAFLDGETRESLYEALDQIQNAYELEIDLAVAYYIYNKTGARDNQEYFLADLSYKILNQMIQLPVGKSLVIPGGFVADTAAHATLIECTRINSYYYVYRFVNTGAGASEIASFKTIVRTGLTLFMDECPIKITDPLGFDWIVSSGFTEKLLKPLLIKSIEPLSDMNQVVLDLHNQKKLHDDSQRINIQLNGVCAHYSIVEWFRNKVGPRTFLLFNCFTLQKVYKRFQQYLPYLNIASTEAAVADLTIAAVKTVDEARNKLTDFITKYEAENDELKEQLSELLKKKEKSITGITDFYKYSAKKSINDKLTTEEKQKINSADAMTNWYKPNVKSLNLFGFIPVTTTMRDDRVEKAIIAKKIAGHQGYLEIATAISGNKNKM